MFLLLCGICCVLILPVFAVGMAGLQDKLLVLSRRSPGRRWGGGGTGMGLEMALGRHPGGRLRLLALLAGSGAGPWAPKLRAGREGRKRRALPTGPVI